MWGELEHVVTVYLAYVRGVSLYKFRSTHMVLDGGCYLFGTIIKWCMKLFYFKFVSAFLIFFLISVL